jgi:hypothetical protein
MSQNCSSHVKDWKYHEPAPINGLGPENYKLQGDMELPEADLCFDH